MPPRSRPDPALTALGHLVRDLRRARGWTQREFAGISGSDRSYISGLENGRRNPTFLALARLSAALDGAILDCMEEYELGTSDGKNYGAA